MIVWFQGNVGSTLKRSLLACLCLSFIGCASIPAGSQPSPQDPWESFNRAIFIGNEGLDGYFLKPITKAYRFLLPSAAQEGVENFFGNYSDIYTALNHLLQGNPGLASKDFMRVVVNTVFGVGGLIDAASPAGLPKHKADFGQTFGVWGIPSGPYVVLPFFGPSSVRDTFGTAADIQTDYLLRFVPDVALRNSITALRVINARSIYYQSGDLFEGAAIDKYTFARDAFIQRRQYLIEQSKAGDDDEPVIMPRFQNPYE